MTTSNETEKPRATWRERIFAFARSLSLTSEERLLILALLLSLLVGAATMHWRREYLLNHPSEIQPSPAKKLPGSQDSAGD